jgi:hypothetical protein
MINLINNIKNLLIFSIVLLLIGAGSWELIRRHIWTVKDKEIIVTKTETKYVKDPSTVSYQTSIEWNKSPIQMKYEFISASSQYTDVYVLAFDMNKSTEQTIRVPVAESGNFKYYVAGGIVAAGIVTYALLK